jgi:hypothetical protein
MVRPIRMIESFQVSNNWLTERVDLGPQKRPRDIQAQDSGRIATGTLPTLNEELTQWRGTYFSWPDPPTEVACPLAAPARTFCQLYTGYFGRLMGGTG